MTAADQGHSPTSPPAGLEELEWSARIALAKGVSRALVLEELVSSGWPRQAAEHFIESVLAACAPRE